MSLTFFTVRLYPITDVRAMTPVERSRAGWRRDQLFGQAVAELSGPHYLRDSRMAPPASDGHWACRGLDAVLRVAISATIATVTEPLANARGRERGAQQLWSGVRPGRPWASSGARSSAATSTGASVTARGPRRSLSDLAHPDGSRHLRLAWASIDQRSGPPGNSLGIAGVAAESFSAARSLFTAAQPMFEIDERLRSPEAGATSRVTSSPGRSRNTEHLDG